ncbi:rhodanese-like domain-containing protein [Halostagnicola sp. A-GB9-2]|uniref:rhodanese-like domain-containing protein n=1 Tax=Halostagnicola sp. A-GB9-2 TaxID=3048066 RepID=UPI0024BF3013|nr:rhodanese-like domain-containing protein [Halostagnicola sp. A-GB9-2]MDJ1432791.1 rhodanese-like domain-containing protein [Halostagnicola sp. A-GB9-2]
MNRRSFLAIAGSGSLATTAGCLDEFGSDDDSGDGDESEYETDSFEGTEIPLAPAEDVHEWFEEDEAKFVDTRGVSQYDAGHIPGAVLSPGIDNEGDDPTDDWSTDTRVVTYCDCPHSLAVRRGADLKADGFEDVYAIDEGYNGWEQAGYPTEYNEADADVETYEIEGESDPSHEDEYVHISTADGGSYEVAPIDGDGIYETEIRFPDLTDDSELIVEAPDYTVEGTLKELTDEPVTADS